MQNVKRRKTSSPTQEIEMSNTAESMQQQAEAFRNRYAAVREQIGRVIVGHDDIVNGVLTAMFVGGHCLLEGVPGLGKTMLIKTLSETLSLDFNRIQFTPDLMPSDILGTNMIVENEGRREFQFQKGPIFTQICLADEINRATPKTQSALLETMQEGTVTVSGNRYELKKPFFVLATQNPIEQEGTYPLPEAQLDRFMFNVKVDYPSFTEEMEIVRNTTSDRKVELKSILKGEDILAFQDLVRKVPVTDNVISYAVKLVGKTRIDSPEAPDYIKDLLSWGAGPRASQYLILGAKAHALLKGKYSPDIEDVRAIAVPVLRHRIVPSFTAEAEGVTADEIIKRLMAS
jgi:MoxR-like ATPase